MPTTAKMKDSQPRPWASPSGIRLLRRIQQHMLRYPKMYRQDQWHCGTAMCVAGLAAILSGRATRATSDENHQPMKGRRRVATDAILPWARLGRLAIGAPTCVYDWVSGGDFIPLFRTPAAWPEPFSDNYRKQGPKAYKARARVGVARIEHYIQTGE